MKRLTTARWIVPVSVLWSAGLAEASFDTIGINGINSASLDLTGAGIGIGQVEFERPGDPDIDDDGVQFEAGVDDDGAHSHFQTNPKAVFIFAGTAPTPNSNSEIVSEAGPPAVSHATEVAGVMISNDVVARGVAPDADLYASGEGPFVPGLSSFEQLALTAQFVATRNGDDIRAINFSFQVPFEPGDSFDGNSLLTQFVDWSAARHEVLYVLGVMRVVYCRASLSLLTVSMASRWRSRQSQPGRMCIAKWTRSTGSISTPTAIAPL